MALEHDLALPKQLAPRSIVVMVAVVAAALPAHARDWQQVYAQSFDAIDAGSETATGRLAQWEGGSAAGVVFDGQCPRVGKFLVAKASWSGFNQGPIFNLDLTAVPHDRVRVRFDLYAFGDWRGLQRKTGGPQHRLMLFDSKAEPRFAFDTNFATHPAFQQSWPQRNPPGIRRRRARAA